MLNDVGLIKDDQHNVQLPPFQKPTMEDLVGVALGASHSEHLSELPKVGTGVFDPRQSRD